MKNSILQSYKSRIGAPKKKRSQKLNISNLKRFDEPEILPSPSNERQNCDKNKSIFVFPGSYYSTRDKLLDFNPEETEKIESLEKKEPDLSWAKEKYGILFREDKFLLKRKTVEKPKPHILRTKPIKAIGSMNRVKAQANSWIRVHKENMHVSLTLKGKFLLHLFLEMVKNAGSAAIKREQKNPQTILSHESALRCRVSKSEKPRLREHLEKLKKIIKEEKSKLERLD